MARLRPPSRPRDIAQVVPERAFQDAVIRYAKLRRFKVAHFRPGQMRNGNWVTPMQGDAGFPDLVLAKSGRVIFAELKRVGGRLTKGQGEWIDTLSGGCVEVYVWTPDSWSEIEEVLGR